MTMATSCERRNCSMNSTVSRSMWLVGSSSRIKSGLPRMILPNATLICQPPESSGIGVSRRSAMPSLGINTSTSRKCSSATARSSKSLLSSSEAWPLAAQRSRSPSISLRARSRKVPRSSSSTVLVSSRSASCCM
mmetsp:Transcript_73245/g.214752  ORF Transcript_73245/g.214752 Transcript_73245/m.214752 type:complete len:135 (+) Transcript_73245:1436-1840(+)